MKSIWIFPFYLNVCLSGLNLANLWINMERGSYGIASFVAFALTITVSCAVYAFIRMKREW